MISAQDARNTGTSTQEAVTVRASIFVRSLRFKHCKLQTFDLEDRLGHQLPLRYRGKPFISRSCDGIRGSCKM
jgi:hypothetical protein